MLFYYKAVSKRGDEAEGSVESTSVDTAISLLQKKDLIIIDIKPAETPGSSRHYLPFTSGIGMKDVVILSQQLATLIGANVPILTTFRLVASESESAALQDRLTQVVDDIQGGM